MPEKAKGQMTTAGEGKGGSSQKMEKKTIEDVLETDNLMDLLIKLKFVTIKEAVELEGQLEQEKEKEFTYWQCPPKMQQKWVEKNERNVEDVAILTNFLADSSEFAESMQHRQLRLRKKYRVQQELDMSALLWLYHDNLMPLRNIAFGKRVDDDKKGVLELLKVWEGMRNMKEAWMDLKCLKLCKFHQFGLNLVEWANRRHGAMEKKGDNAAAIWSEWEEALVAANKDRTQVEIFISLLRQQKSGDCESEEGAQIFAEKIVKKLGTKLAMVHFHRVDGLIESSERMRHFLCHDYAPSYKMNMANYMLGGPQLLMKLEHKYPEILQIDVIYKDVQAKLYEQFLSAPSHSDTLALEAERQLAVRLLMKRVNVFRNPPELMPNEKGGEVHAVTGQIGWRKMSWLKKVAFEGSGEGVDWFNQPINICRLWAFIDIMSPLVGSSGEFKFPEKRHNYSGIKYRILAWNGKECHDGKIQEKHWKELKAHFSADHYQFATENLNKMLNLLAKNGRRTRMERLIKDFRQKPEFQVENLYTDDFRMKDHFLEAISVGNAKKRCANGMGLGLLLWARFIEKMMGERGEEATGFGEIWRRHQWAIRAAYDGIFEEEEENGRKNDEKGKGKKGKEGKMGERGEDRRILVMAFRLKMLLEKYAAGENDKIEREFAKIISDKKEKVETKEENNFEEFTRWLEERKGQWILKELTEDKDFREEMREATKKQKDWRKHLHNLIIDKTAVDKVLEILEENSAETEEKRRKEEEKQKRKRRNRKKPKQIHEGEEDFFSPKSSFESTDDYLSFSSEDETTNEEDPIGAAISGIPAGHKLTERKEEEAQGIVEREEGKPPSTDASRKREEEKKKKMKGKKEGQKKQIGGQAKKQSTKVEEREEEGERKEDAEEQAGEMRPKSASSSSSQNVSSTMGKFEMSQIFTTYEEEEEEEEGESERRGPWIEVPGRKAWTKSKSSASSISSSGRMSSLGGHSPRLTSPRLEERGRGGRKEKEREGIRKEPPSGGQKVIQQNPSASTSRKRWQKEAIISPKSFADSLFLFKFEREHREWLKKHENEEEEEDGLISLYKIGKRVNEVEEIFRRIEEKIKAMEGGGEGGGGGGGGGLYKYAHICGEWAALKNGMLSKPVANPEKVLKALDKVVNEVPAELIRNLLRNANDGGEENEEKRRENEATDMLQQILNESGFGELAISEKASSKLFPTEEERKILRRAEAVEDTVFRMKNIVDHSWDIGRSHCWLTSGSYLYSAHSVHSDIDALLLFPYHPQIWRSQLTIREHQDELDFRLGKLDEIRLISELHFFGGESTCRGNGKCQLEWPQHSHSLFCRLCMLGVKKMQKIRRPVPLIKLEFNEVEFDLIFVAIPVPVGNHVGHWNQEYFKRMDAIDQAIGMFIEFHGTYLADDRTDMTSGMLNSLSGYRANLRMNELILAAGQRDTFTHALLALKLWAKRHFIYGSQLGFFNGVTLAVMVCKLAIEHRNASVLTLLELFFDKYSKWKADDSIVAIEETDDFASKGSSGSRHVRQDVTALLAQSDAVRKWHEQIRRDMDWNEKKEEAARQRHFHTFDTRYHWLADYSQRCWVVVPPGFPTQNAAFNVNKQTERIMRREMENAVEKFSAVKNMVAMGGQQKGMLANTLKSWLNGGSREAIKFDQKYRHYLLVVCKFGPSSQHGRAFCEYAENRIRLQLLFSLGEIGQRNNLVFHAKPERMVSEKPCWAEEMAGEWMRVGGGGGGWHCTVWLIGIVEEMWGGGGKEGGEQGAAWNRGMADFVAKIRNDYKREKLGRNSQRRSDEAEEEAEDVLEEQRTLGFGLKMKRLDRELIVVEDWYKMTMAPEEWPALRRAAGN